MNRLTQKDEQGNWCVKELPWDKICVGATITRETWEKMYGAFYKLKDYEDTGLSPAGVKELNSFDGSQAIKATAKLQEEQRKHKWILVEERLPKERGLYLVTCSGCVYGGEYRSINHYNGDEWTEDKTRLRGDRVIAWMPLPAPYRPEVLKKAGEYADQDTLMPAT